MKKKNLKKFLTCVITLVMFFSLFTPMVYADENVADVNITIEQENADAQFSAFRILNATNDGDKYAYTFNEKYETILKEVTNLTTQMEVVDYISKLDADGIRLFADTVYEKIVANGLTADALSDNSGFSGIDQGYYLIAETTIGTQPDSASLIMLDTLGEENITVTTKEDIPELEKKVQEINDSTGTTAWQDGADYDIGDFVKFKLTGDLPSNFYGYDNYEYIVHDTLSAGLTFNGDLKVYVQNGEDKVDITNQVDQTPAEGDTITVSIKDLKALTGVTVNSTSLIIVEYSATLNENAVIGSAGNPNVANLEFSNNPYDDGHGETPKDKVVVFTFESIVNKVDKDGNSLVGAGFTLYKYDAEAGEYLPVGEELIGEDMTTFEFTGLDSGEYKLVETTIPDGYNKADDIVFTITAEYEIESADPSFIDLKVNDEATGMFTIDVPNGILETDVTNLSGTKLPETGGLGTTLFYLFGGALVVCTGLVLITRKRVGVEEEQ